MVNDPTSEQRSFVIWASPSWPGFAPRDLLEMGESEPGHVMPFTDAQ
jgi:hypothetical protein